MSFKFINLPFSYVISWFNDITGSYIIALFLFALVIKIVLSPISIKQHKTQLRQASLRPKEQAIKKKYAGRTDKTTQQKMQQEIGELYQREGYNQLSGCLPLILQLFIMISLYAIIRQPLTYICRIDGEVIKTAFDTLKGEGFGAVISNVQDEISILREILALTPDKLAEFQSAVPEMTGSVIASFPDFTVFGVFDLATVPNIKEPSWLLVIPVLVFASQYLSMKVTRKYAVVQAPQQEGMSNKIMDFSMPMMSVVFCFMFSAAIAVYWIFQSVLAMAQSWLLYKLMPPPEFTEEDYKTAERALAGKSNHSYKNAAIADPDRPRPKSLHRIDNEEYESGASAPTRYDREEDPAGQDEKGKKESAGQDAEAEKSAKKNAPALKEDKNRQNYKKK